MPRISVIVPTFNRSHLVSQAIASVLSQTFEDIQLVVVDDGSSDNTEAVLRLIADTRLHYLRQMNLGVSAARNVGIQIADGDLIAFLDSDDVCMPDRFLHEIAVLQDEPDTGLVYGWYLVDGGDENPRRLIKSRSQTVQLSDLLLGPVFHWSTTLIRRSWLEMAGGFDERLRVGGDWDLSIRLHLAGCSMMCAPKPLSIIRHQRASLTRDFASHQASKFMILDKSFRDPRMPPSLLAIKQLAKASHLIRVAGSAYLSREPDTGKAILDEAIALEPRLTDRDLGFMSTRLVDYLHGLSTVDPKETLKAVSTHLPGSKAFRRIFRWKLWGRFHLVRTFHEFELGDLDQVRSHAIRAVAYSPSCLGNPGFRSILVRSFVGDRLFHRLRRIKRALSSR